MRAGRELAQRESATSWKELLEGLKGRGLRGCGWW